MDETVCFTQSTTASFTCVVDRGSTRITNAGWRILDGEHYTSVVGRSRHMVNPIRNGDIITDTLTITDVSINDNGAQYRCQPDIGNVTSITVTLTVLGETIICMHIYVAHVCICIYEYYMIYFHSMKLYSTSISHMVCICMVGVKRSTVCNYVCIPAMQLSQVARPLFLDLS